MRDLNELKRQVESAQKSYRDALERHDRASGTVQDLIAALEQELDSRCEELVQNHRDYKRIAREYDQLRTLLDYLRAGREAVDLPDLGVEPVRLAPAAAEEPAPGADEAAAPEGTPEVGPGQPVEEANVRPEDVRSGLERMFGRRARARLADGDKTASG